MKTAIVTTLLFATCATSLSAQFAPGVAISSSVTDVQELRVLDLNGDTHQDVVVRQSHAISWFANDGNGNFSALDTIHVSQGELGAFDLADVQGDELPDLVVADAGTDSVLLLLNNGGGTFDTPNGVFGLEGGLPFKIVLADILEDDSPELLVNMGGQIQALVNMGGDFSISPILLAQGILNPGFYVLDTDGDTDRDLVTFISIEGALRIYLNPGVTGDPWLQEIAFGWISGGKPMRMLDVDGDGDLDLASASSSNMAWIDFEPDETGAIVPWFLSGTAHNLHRIGWTARLGCGLGASMLWTDSIGGPVQWATYDAVLENFGPVSVLSDLPSFQAIHSGDLNGDGKEDLVLWDGNDQLTWHGNLIEEPTQEVLITPFDTLCNASVPYVLDHALQEGGTWSGAGVDTGAFTPTSAGEFELFYTLLDPESGCPYSGARTMVVINTPTMTADTELNDICATGQIQLTGIPTGGAWSGAANVLGVIDNDTLTRPFMGGIYYTYTDASGSACESAEFYQLQLFSPLGYTNPGPYCVGDEVQAFQISGSMLGSVWASGSGVVDVVPMPPVTTVTFDPSVGAGYHVIELTSMSPMHCNVVRVDSIRVFPEPVVQLTLANFCTNGPLVELEGAGTPADGSFFLDGSEDPITQIDPAMIGSGAHDLSYTYTDLNMCSATESGSFSVFDPPVVTLENDVLCSNGPIMESLGYESPLGGVFYINDEEDPITEFDPANLTDAIYDFTYVYTDSLTGCIGSASSTFTVEVCVGLAENRDSEVQIYPSPATNSVTLSGQLPANVQFIDAAGRVSLSIPNLQPRTSIDVSSLESGLYTVIAITQNERKVGRVMIE